MWLFSLEVIQIDKFPLSIIQWNSLEEEDMGRLISPLVTQGTSQFPTYGLAVVMEDWFLPLEASPLVVGINLPSRLLRHAWGIGMCLSWLVGKSYFLQLVASPLVVGNIPSHTLFLKGMAHCWNFQNLIAKLLTFSIPFFHCHTLSNILI